MSHIAKHRCQALITYMSYKEGAKKDRQCKKKQKHDGLCARHIALKSVGVVFGRV